MTLPPPCNECEPEGLWVWKNGGMTRCECPRGLALAAMDQARREPVISHVEPRISIETASSGVAILAALKFFPADDGARIAIGDELRSMCNTGDEMVWVCARALRLFSEWPGVQAIRAVYCSKFFPLDRDTRAECPEYPDGVPAEVVAPAPLLLPPAGAKAMRRLTAGNDLGSLVRSMPVKNQSVPVSPTHMPITQREIEQAVRELHEQHDAAGSQ